MRRIFLMVVVPYIFFLNTRLKSKVQRVSWIFVYFIPNIYLFNHFKPLDEGINIFLLFISIVVINLFYENGYIENDCKTIKFEKKPQLRLNIDEINWINKYWSFIIVTRIIIASLLISLFYYLSEDIRSASILIFISILIQGLYLIYNRIRNRLNLLLILPLSYLRFYGFIMPFVLNDSLKDFILATIFIYPLSKTLEFASRKRFNLEFFIKYLKDINRFRVFYYLVFTILFLLLSAKSIYLVVIIYYLIYRVVVWILVEKTPGINKYLSNRKS